MTTRNGTSLSSLSTSSGKQLLSTKAQCTTEDRKVQSSNSLDGPMRTLKKSVNLSERWVGWALRYSLLKKVSFPLNGLNRVSLTLGGSTISL